MIGAFRTFREDDIPAAMRLKEAAGWNQTEQDWLTVLDVAAGQCWVRELDGNVVGTVTAVSYGREDLNWLEMLQACSQERSSCSDAYDDGSLRETYGSQVTDRGWADRVR